MLLSALAFSLMVVGVKQVGDRLPIAEVVLARALVSLVLSYGMVRRLGVDPWGRRRGLLLLRGLVGSAALFCVYAAVVHLPLAAATVLQYLYPTFTALLAMGLGWLGVLLVAQPTASSALPVAWVLVAVAGALLTAVAYVSVRSLAESEEPAVIIFYFPLVALPMSLPLVLLDPVLPTPAELLWLLGVGVFTQLGQVGLTRALTQLPAARATAISYVQVGFAALWGWWIFGEAIDLPTAIGAALILMATLICLGQPLLR
nr:DMT family transporter [Synechococcus sp. CCY 0621]